MNHKPHAARPQSEWSFRLALPMVREAFTNTNGSAVKVRTPAEIAALCADLQNSAQECFLVIDLNAKNGVIDKRLVSLGILDASLVHPREIFRGAILNSAAAVICVHNHPSGDPTPSAEDLAITRQLIQAGKILGIRVIDHVIVGRDLGNGSPTFISMREAGLCEF